MFTSPETQDPPSGKEQDEIDVKELLHPVTLNGVMDPGEWDDATMVRLNYETDPGNNIPASSDTWFYLKYDSDNIYFAFRAIDEDPSQIRAFISDRDNARNNDRVGIFIDPFNTNASAYDFTLNPLGIQEDGVLFGGGGGYDSSWNGLWDSAGRINEEGFFVEARIPLKSIRYPSGTSVQTWSISAWRKIPRSVEVETRSHPVLQDLNCFLCQFNRFTGFENLSENRNIEILPTYVGNKTDRRTGGTEGDMDGGRIVTSLGGDLRLGITNNLILNSTINPDFSQVEADAAQLDINNRFALRFPEQRPFFQEGVEIYNTPEEAVFTRTIADPIHGNKLTAKIGKHEAATLVAQDQVNNLIFPSNDGSSQGFVDQHTTSVISRYRYNASDALMAGVLSTVRFAEDYHNILTGGDVFFRPNDPITIELQYMRSETSYSDLIADEFGQSVTPFSGNALALNTEYDTRDWQARFNYRYRDEEFRADAGFIPQVDVEGGSAFLRKKLWKDVPGWYTRFFFTVGGSRFFNMQNQLTSEDVFVSMSYLGPWQSEWDVRYTPRSSTRFLDQLYVQRDGFTTSLSMRPTALLRFGGSFGSRDQIDIENLSLGRQLRYTASLDVRIGRHIETEFDYNFTRLNRGNRYLFRAQIYESNIRFNITPRIFIRSILQYRRTVRNQDLYQEPIRPDQQRLFSQWLFSYRFNAQSVIFLGYSDNFLGFENQFQEQIPLTQTDRTFFFKIGYVWRF